MSFKSFSSQKEWESAISTMKPSPSPTSVNVVFAGFANATNSAHVFLIACRHDGKYAIIDAQRTPKECWLNDNTSCVEYLSDKKVYWLLYSS